MNAQTPLERLLQAATHDVGLRPAFYQCLLSSDVLVPIARHLHPGSQVAAETTLHVWTLQRFDGVAVIPFYSSRATAYDAPGGAEKYAVMPVRELFQARPDMPLHLNPFSPFGRSFDSDEVRQLLTTGMVGGATEEHLIPDDGSLGLGQPENVPDAMLAALRVLYARHFAVKAAYLAQLSRAGSATSLLIAIDCDSDVLERVAQESATVITDTWPGNLPVDVTRLEHDGSTLAGYLAHVAPFYERGWGARFTPARSLS